MSDEDESEPTLGTDWRQAALRVGEELSSCGPSGYYDFTPRQWLTWALAALKTAPPLPQPEGETRDDPTYQEALHRPDFALKPSKPWPRPDAPCPECDGEGTVLDAPADVLGGHPYQTECPECHGTGKKP